MTREVVSTEQQHVHNTTEFHDPTTMFDHIGGDPHVGSEEYPRRINKLSPRQRDFLHHLYGPISNDFLNNLAQVSEEDREKAQTLEELFFLGFDSGLAEPKNFDGQRSPVVHMMRRSAWARVVCERLDQDPDTDITLLTFDVQGVGKMNLVEDYDGNNSGDFTLNLVADAIQGEDIECRVAGDEFAIAIFSRDRSYIERRKKQIEQRVNALQAVYKDSPQSQPNVTFVGLKPSPTGETIQESKLPDESTIEGKISRTFLEKGIILDNKKIERIKEKFGYDESAIEDYLENEKNKRYIYPAPGYGIQDKVAYLKHAHPELALYLQYAEDLDSQDVRRGVTERQERVVNFIENTLYSPTLHENMYTLVELQTHIQQGLISEAFSLEFKFLKEIDDVMSFADGDENLEYIWEQISKTLGDEKENFIFYQRAGAFVLGVREGHSISTDLRQKLLSTSQLGIFKDGNTYGEEVPIGVAHSDITAMKRTKHEARGIVGRLLGNSSKDWFEKAFSRIKHEGLLADLYNQNLYPWENIEYSQMNFKEMIWRFFHGKRALMRTEEGLETFEHDPRIDQSLMNHYRDIFAFLQDHQANQYDKN